MKLRCTEYADYTTTAADVSGCQARIPTESGEIKTTQGRTCIISFRLGIGNT